MVLVGYDLLEKVGDVVLVVIVSGLLLGVLEIMDVLVFEVAAAGRKLPVWARSVSSATWRM